MKLKKFKPLFRGVAATTAALLTVSTVGYGIAKSELAVGWVDGFFGVDRTIYTDWTEEVPGYTISGEFEGYQYKKGVSYATTYKSADAYFEAHKANAIKQGEEGFALLKNDNSALPLDKSNEVVLFGWNCYNTPNGHTGTNAGNSDKITLKDAFDSISGIKVNSTVTSEDFPTGMGGAGSWVERDFVYEASAGSWGGGSKKTYGETFAENSNWKIDKNSTAIVAVGRGGGEGANWKPDSVPGGGDPLELSPNELQMIRYAKEHCSKVVLLIVSANSMEIGKAVEKGGEYEVDAIGFCGIPNDYQYQGIANVLAGKVNATGGLTDTYVYDNSFNPANINTGEQQYSDTDTITSTADMLGREGTVSYRANNYVIEAEGIYVGYKYYETRYYDSIVNPGYNANDTVGSTKKGSAWNYSNEVVFQFGQSLSYIPYTQEITDVEVDLSEHGKVTATVKVTNNGKEDGTFLAQLYVNRPYTQYDINNKVEKSAVDFLNSAKVEVKAGKSAEVEITVPTRYLASWDSKALGGAGTYIMDDGDYKFTAAAGAHAATNNFLTQLGKSTDDTTTNGPVVTWNLEKFDETTYSVSNGVEVRNQLQNSDINYFYGEEKVTYLTRSDWKGTFPKNYTNYTNGSGITPEAPFTIKGAAKQTEWVKELQNAQYKVTPVADSSKWVNVEGVKPASLKEGQTVWQWILSFATSDPEAFSDIHSDEWQAVAAAINLGSAISSIGESGGSSRTFDEIGNPISKQSESVSGYQQSITLEDGTKRNLNINSNTLLGASFNPELAYEAGVLEGEGGLWLQEQGVGSGQAVTVWGMGLNQHRNAYNGRNSEYMSEDPMLTNRIGEAQMRGAVSKGAICGPKHMGFNDQELNRQGNACYMTEQKARETDTRCYEGALRLDEGNGTGVMMSFARIGATNVTNSVGYITNIMRGEWGFTGIISTDMGQAGYHEVGAMVMATCNEYAGFGSGTIYTDVTDDAGTFAKATYITLGDARKDPTFANQARQTALYILYTLAHSGSGINVERIESIGEDIEVPPSTIEHHDPTGTKDIVGWEYIFISLEVVFAVLTAVAGIAYIASVVVPEKEEN